MGKVRVAYVLSKSDYFSEGERGRVSHALGVIEGLVGNGLPVAVYSGPGLGKFVDGGGRKVEVFEVGAGSGGLGRIGESSWRRRLTRLLSKHIDKVDAVILRYAASQQILVRRVARLAEEHDCTSILEVNSLAYHYLGFLPQIIGDAVRRIEVSSLSEFEVVYVVSNGLKDQVEEAGCDSEVVVVPNAASEELAGRTHRDDVEGVCKRIVYCGVFQPYYDFDVLIDAFHGLDREGAILAFYGYGPGLSDAQEHAAGDRRIQFQGRYDHDRLPELMHPEQDVAVLPYSESSLSEIGSPTKLYEYLALGVPIVGADVGQVGEVVEHGRTGYLYRAGDVASLADTLAYVLDHPEERRRVGASAAKEFLREHTWKARMSTIAQLCG